MAQGNPIVVFLTFNTLIEANIIKTKLDAYGIPCFLSEENLNSLITPLLCGGIRLHIFEEDRQRVADVLSLDWLQKSEDDDLLKCPKCRSKRILETSDKFLNPAQVVRFFLQLSKKHYCLDCETEFDH